MILRLEAAGWGKPLSSKARVETHFFIKLPNPIKWKHDQTLSWGSGCGRSYTIGAPVVSDKPKGKRCKECEIKYEREYAQTYQP